MSFGTSALIVNSTTKKYLKGAAKAIMRKRYLLAKMQAMGCIKLNQSGTEHEWKIRHKRSTMSTLTDGGVLTFRKENKHKKATMRPRAYSVTGAISWFDKQMNKGNEALIQLWSNAVQERVDDFKDGFPEKLYTADGYSSGSEEIMGLPSAFSATGSASSLFGTNNDTYAGLSTARGAYGGLWSGTWPYGTGSSQYDFHTPIVVNYTSSLAGSGGGFQSDTASWATRGVEALRLGIMASRRNGGPLHGIVMEWNMFRQFLDQAAQDTSLVVQRNQDPGMTKLGFQSVSLDGTDILWEVGVPSGYAYGFNFEEMELLVWADQLLHSETEFNLESLADRVALVFFGNLKLRTLRGLLQFAPLS